MNRNIYIIILAAVLVVLGVSYGLARGPFDGMGGGYGMMHGGYGSGMMHDSYGGERGYGSMHGYGAQGGRGFENGPYTNEPSLSYPNREGSRFDENISGLQLQLEQKRQELAGLYQSKDIDREALDRKTEELFSLERYLDEKLSR